MFFYRTRYFKKWAYFQRHATHLQNNITRWREVENEYLDITSKPLCLVHESNFTILRHHRKMLQYFYKLTNLKQKKNNFFWSRKLFELFFLNLFLCLNFLLKQKSSLKHSEVYADHPEKRRKRGSLFFRKKKDKSKTKGQSTNCDGK